MLNVLEDAMVNRMFFNEYPGWASYFDEMVRFASHGVKPLDPSESDELLVIKSLVMEKMLGVYNPALKRGYYDGLTRPQTGLVETGLGLADAEVLTFEDAVESARKIVERLEDAFGLFFPEPMEVEAESTVSEDGSFFDASVEGVTAARHFDDSPWEVIKKPGWMPDGDVKTQKIEVNVKNFDRKDLEVDAGKLKHADEIASAMWVPLKRLESHFDKRVEEYEQEFGDIDSDELHNLGVSKFVFEEEEEQRRPSFKVSLLVDMSGSMTYDKMQRAEVAALGLFKGLVGTEGLECKVYGHQTQRGGCRLVRFYDADKDVVDATALLNFYSGGENADGVAVAAAADVSGLGAGDLLQPRVP